MSGTYVTDLHHFLDESGNIVVDMPEEARQLAGFLALVVDETSNSLAIAKELSLRCRSDGCLGKILGAVEDTKEIQWHCPACGHQGVIRNWQGTKWDNSSG